MTQITKGMIAILLMAVLLLGYGGLCSKSDSGSSAPVPTTVAFSTQPVNTVAGATMANVVVNVKDENAANMVGQAVSITTTNGTLLSGTLITNTDAAGNATFNDLVMTLTGTYAFSATAGSVITASANFDITSSIAQNLTFVAQPPASTVAGVNFASTVTVRVRDQYSNNVTGASVSITTTNGTAMNGTLVTNSDTSGIATFSPLSMTVAAAGYALSASATGCTTITSNGFDITTAAVDHYVVVAPASVVTNTDQTGTVKAQDVYNNDIATASTTLTMSKTDVTGTPTVTFYTSNTYATTTTTYSYTGGTSTIWFRATHDGTAPDTCTIKATDAGTKTGTSGNMDVTN